ncbi:MAG: hypothetical protein WAW37_12430 [Syntrophobacteraceae bacterium]
MKNAREKTAHVSAGGGVANTAALKRMGKSLVVGQAETGCCPNKIKAAENRARLGYSDAEDHGHEKQD